MTKKINLQTGIALFLLLVGSFLRIYKWSQLNVFAGDEGIQLIYAEDILSGKYLTITGEVSSLDQENKYIFHNSPIGLYFQAILYLLSCKTAKFYLFTYVIINIIIILLLYRTLEIISSKKVANIAGVILLFSPFMLHASVWTSQPINALFFESIAIFLTAQFIKKRKDYLFLAGAIASVIATQMYPPMYLLFFPKTLLFIYLLSRHVKKKSQIILYFTLMIILIYLPFLLMELKYNHINLNEILLFIRELEEDNFLIKTTNPISIVDKFKQLTNNILFFFSYSFQNEKFILPLYSIFISLGLFRKSNKKQIKIVVISAAFLFIPIFIFALLLMYHSISGERAYMDIIFPYLIIFFALLHSKIKPIIINFFITIYILITVLPMRQYFLKTNSDLTTLNTISQSIDIVLNDANKNHISNPLIHVISDGDKWGWDGSIYWYLIEKKTNKDVVSIDLHTNKPKLNKNTESTRMYLICHHYPINKCLNDWNVVNNSQFYDTKFTKIMNYYNMYYNNIVILDKKKL